MKCNRCYLRGTSLLGLFNTIIGCLFNRVLVQMVDNVTHKTVGWRWDKATDWPAVEESENDVKEEDEEES